MLKIRLAKERGHSGYDWLDSWHSFSFANYYDPEFSGFSALRVINEDRVASGKGFGMHPHRDMEIISYVISGELEHLDSIANGSIIKSGEFQLMSAGSGINHSEFNPSKINPCHFYQIWITPNVKSTAPYYQKLSLPSASTGELQLIAGPETSTGQLKIKQNAYIYQARLAFGTELTVPLDRQRSYWLQVISGKLQAGKFVIESGDGIAITEEKEISCLGQVADSLILLFDLPALSP